MMRYVLDSDEFVKLSETSGTVMNIGVVKIELSNKAESGTGIILCPRKKITIKGNVYAARGAGSSGVALLATFESGGGGSSGGDSGTSPGTIPGGGGSLDDEHFTDDDLSAVFDGEIIDDDHFTIDDFNNVFADGDISADGSFTADDLNEVFKD